MQSTPLSARAPRAPLSFLWPLAGGSGIAGVCIVALTALLGQVIETGVALGHPDQGLVLGLGALALAALGGGLGGSLYPLRRYLRHILQTLSAGPPAASAGWTELPELVALADLATGRQVLDQALQQRVQTTARELQEATQILAVVGAQQMDGAQDQATALAQVTVTVEELAQTATQIAAATESVAVAVVQALTSANQGQGTVRDSLIGMGLIRGRVDDIIARILALSGEMQRVEAIVTPLSAIAARTHILALNAAVESAAAGEDGQRFAVVAGEVKKLAQRSQGATRAAQAILAQLQAATAAAVMATEEGLKEADRGQVLAQQSSVANEEVIAAVEQTTHLAATIHLATQQQRTASAQVVTTLRAALEQTRATVAIGQRSEPALVRLNVLSPALQTLLGKDRGPWPPEPLSPASSLAWKEAGPLAG